MRKKNYYSESLKLFWKNKLAGTVSPDPGDPDRIRDPGTGSHSI